MKNAVLFMIVFGFNFSAKADIVKCYFTEPFLFTEYSMAEQKLTIDYVVGETEVINNVSFQIMGQGEFELWDKNKEVLQILSLNFAGSDGMSDRLYPYSGYSTSALVGGVGQIGGCSSNQFPVQ